MSWRQFFPNYEVPAAIERIEGITDTSWFNDGCPSFAGDGEHVKLWVDHPKPAARNQDGRYSVTVWDDGGGNETFWEGDDMAEAVRQFLIARHENRGST